MSDDEQVMILCPLDTPPGIAGSLQVPAGCGHQAWISPSGLAFVLAQGCRTVCERCVPPGPVELGEIPGGREELAAHIGKARADAIVDGVKAYTDAGGDFRKLFRKPDPRKGTT
jgi:hypothetical protein